MGCSSRDSGWMKNAWNYKLLAFSSSHRSFLFGAGEQTSADDVDPGSGDGPRIAPSAVRSRIEALDVYVIAELEPRFIS